MAVGSFGAGKHHHQQQGDQIQIQTQTQSQSQLVAMGNNKVNAIVGMACACSFVYVLSLILMSSRPCWDTCQSTPCAPYAQTTSEILMASPTPSVSSVSQKKQEPVLVSNTLTPLPQPDRESNSALRAAETAKDTTGGSLEQCTLGGRKTDLSRVVFGIAAATDMWWDRKEYLKLWWKPSTMRGFVWLDKPPYGKWGSEFPPYKVSQNTSDFKYTYKRGWRSAIRISRIVSETFRLGLPNVDWFVLGDDDTLFFPDNLIRVLSKYDHTKMYYIGSNSESHLQNVLFSYNMAFGGGGFALSYPLVKALARMQDDCLSRYPHLFGSDDRMHACMAELGIPLTKEPGFHQFDIHGDASGLLASHPVVPLVSIHHLDLIDPIFPDTQKKNHSRVSALQHFLESVKVESGSILQQSICYDAKRRWSFTVSWGYVIQVHKGFITPRELEVPQKTFLSWHKETSKVEFPFNTRDNPEDVCKKPTRFFMHSVKAATAAASNSNSKDLMESVFLREWSPSKKECSGQLQPLSFVQRIRVMKEMTSESWYQMPRRPCCRIKKWKNDHIDIHVGECKENESLVSSF